MASTGLFSEATPAAVAESLDRCSNEATLKSSSVTSLLVVHAISDEPKDSVGGL
jgi:hypothetical protein